MEVNLFCYNKDENFTERGKTMKAKILGSIALIVILIAGITGCFVYQKQKEQTKIEQQRREAKKEAKEEKAVEEEIDKVAEKEKTFAKTEAHEEKLNLLKSTLTEMEEYKESEKHSKKVSEKYESVVSSMQEAFQKEYDSNIEQTTLENLESVEDISALTGSKDNLTALLSTIEAEKDYVFASNDDFETYKQKITELTEAYTSRIAAVEEAKNKAEEEAARKAEEEAKARTHYENEYFSVDVPKEWDGYWSVTEEDNSVTGIFGTIFSRIYHFSYDPTEENHGGGADIYILDMSNTDIPLHVYSSMIPPTPDTSVGRTSTGMDVFDIEVGAGFFTSDATLTLK